jgi:hypothetical protein
MRSVFQIVAPSIAAATLAVAGAGTSQAQVQATASQAQDLWPRESVTQKHFDGAKGCLVKAVSAGAPVGMTVVPTGAHGQPMRNSPSAVAQGSDGKDQHRFAVIGDNLTGDYILRGTVIRADVKLATRTVTTKVHSSAGVNPQTLHTDKAVASALSLQVANRYTACMNGLGLSPTLSR